VVLGNLSRTNASNETRPFSGNPSPALKKSQNVWVETTRSRKRRISERDVKEIHEKKSARKTIMKSGGKILQKILKKKE